MFWAQYSRRKCQICCETSKKCVHGECSCKENQRPNSRAEYGPIRHSLKPRQTRSRTRSSTHSKLPAGVYEMCSQHLQSRGNWATLCFHRPGESNRAQHITCCSTECALAVLEPGLSRCFHRRIQEVIYQRVSREEKVFSLRSLWTSFVSWRKKEGTALFFFFSAKLRS